MVNASHFKGKDVLSMRAYGREEIDFILNKATEMIPLSEKGCKLCEGKILATLFFEPSTRSRLSFEASMLRLGGGVTGFSDPSASSVKKGETLEDTIRTVESYADIIAMRHPEEDAAIRAAKVAKVPILNGGSGPGEHPTQALLDLRGAEKRRCIEQLRSRYAGARIAAYGNAASDFEHLEVVDAPLVVNATPVTRRRAQARRLPVADWTR